MSRIAVIGVPSSAGARRTGQERAPQSFRQAGLLERLQSIGLPVVDYGDLPEVSFRPDVANPHQQNLGLVCEVIRRVADQVSRAARDQALPVVLGGDCSVTLGVVEGWTRHARRVGLIYFDGDVDLNTPAETLTGIFDGMVMAHLVGRGASGLARAGSRYPLLNEEEIVLFGYNTEAGFIDPAEMECLKRCSMSKYPVAGIRGRAADAARSALTGLEGLVDDVLVHFDVDVIESRDFPAADVPHRHGLGFNEAMEALQVFAGSSKFAGLVITEFNADHDAEGSLARRLVAGVGDALEKGLRSRPPRLRVSA